MVWLRWTLTALGVLLGLLASVAIAVSFCLWINYRWNVPFGWWYISFTVCSLFGLVLAFGLVMRRVVRQRWRFGSRTMLFALTLVAIGAALFGNRVHFAWRQQMAVSQLIQQGGSPSPTFLKNNQTSHWLYNHLGYDPFQSIDFVELHGNKALAALAEHSDDFPHLTGLYVIGMHMNDSALLNLQRLTNLKNLWIGKSNVTPEFDQALRAALPGCEIAVGN